MDLVECAAADLDLLAPYRHDRAPRRGRSWVLANMVAGLDGSASVGGRVGALSTDADARLFRALRALADVVLVGAATVRAERYGPVVLPDELVHERVEAGRSPVPRLAVVSRSLDLDETIGMFADASPDAPPLVLTGAGADAERRAGAARHAEVVVAGEREVELAAALGALADRGLTTVLCEGGPHLLGELVAADLLDELCLTIAPMMGGDPLPVAVAPTLAPPTAFVLRHLAQADGTVFLRYVRAHG